MEWAENFVQNCSVGEVIALHGNLGSGKTVLTKGFAKGLGYEGDVNSPSYALVNEYRGPIPIFHVDLYRLDENADWEEIGLDYYTSQAGLCIVEWPERTTLDFDIWINIVTLDEKKRQIEVTRPN